MKKLMMASVLCALCLVPCVVRAEVHYGVQIEDLYYDLDDSTMTAEVTKSYSEYSMATVEIPASVTDGVNFYAVTSIGMDAFSDCTSLKSVSAPSVTSIGVSAFSYCTALESVYAPSVTSIGGKAFLSCTSLTSVYAPSVTSIEKGVFVGCNSLASLTVNSAMKEGWDKGVYGIPSTCNVTFLTTPTLKWDQVAQAEWKAETTVTVSTALKIGDTTLDKAEYEYACGFYGITPKTEPTAEDFKVVSKDAQVVKEGEIAVTKESLQAAKAETVEIVDGMVYLGVSVLSNANFTAETESWGKVKFDENTKVSTSEDKTQLIISIPVADKQGFMILQSGEGKIAPSEDEGSSDPGGAPETSDTPGTPFSPPQRM